MDHSFLVTMVGAERLRLPDYVAGKAQFVYMLAKEGKEQPDGSGPGSPSSTWLN